MGWRDGEGGWGGRGVILCDSYFETDCRRSVRGELTILTASVIKTLIRIQNNLWGSDPL